MRNEEKYICKLSLNEGEIYTLQEMQAIYDDRACELVFPTFESWINNMIEAGYYAKLSITNKPVLHPVEKVLNMTLSPEQLDDIRLQWRAFFADPLKYKDTMVPEMVKQYLSELEKETRLN